MQVEREEKGRPVTILRCTKKIRGNSRDDPRRPRVDPRPPPEKRFDQTPPRRNTSSENPARSARRPDSLAIEIAPHEKGTPGAASPGRGAPTTSPRVGPRPSPRFRLATPGRPLQNSARNFDRDGASNERRRLPFVGRDTVERRGRREVRRGDAPPRVGAGGRRQTSALRVLACGGRQSTLMIRRDERPGGGVSRPLPPASIKTSEGLVSSTTLVARPALAGR